MREKRGNAAKTVRVSRRRLSRVFGRLIVLCLVISAMAAIAVFSVSAAVVASTSDRVIDASTAREAGGFDCILVLGAGVRDDGSPSAMLYDRVKTGIALYGDGVSGRLLMSGDHGRKDYDEMRASILTRCFAIMRAFRHTRAFTARRRYSARSACLSFLRNITSTVRCISHVSWGLMPTAWVPMCVPTAGRDIAICANRSHASRIFSHLSSSRSRHISATAYRYRGPAVLPTVDV